MMSKDFSNRPIGRPPSKLLTPVISWSARRHLRKYCNDPWNTALSQEKSRVLRGTAETRSRTPQMDQARSKHNPQAPKLIRHGKTVLRRTDEYACMWRCSVCCSWSKDPAKKRSYSKCSVCQLVRPPQVFVFPTKNVDFLRNHAAGVHAWAAEMRMRRYNLILHGPTIRHKRQTCVKSAEFFLLAAKMRDEALAPLPATPEESALEQRHTQVWANGGERYVGWAEKDYCSGNTILPGLADRLLGLCATPEALATYDLCPAPRKLAKQQGKSMGKQKDVVTIGPDKDRMTRSASATWLGLEIRNTLLATGMCDVFIVQSKGGILVVQFGVKADQAANWQKFLADLLTSIDDHEVFLGQQFLVIKGIPVAPWLLRIEASDAQQLPKAVMAVRKAFVRVKDGRVDLPKPKNYNWFYEKLYGDPVEDFAEPTVKAE